MAMNPKSCEDRANFCEKLANETKNEAVKGSLLEIAGHWRQIGRENSSVLGLLAFLDSLDLPGAKIADGGPKKGNSQSQGDEPPDVETA